MGVQKGDHTAMKYIVMLGDGMADYPIEALGGRTPLEAAKKPNIDKLARGGEMGMVKTVPDGKALCRGMGGKRGILHRAASWEER